MIKEFVSISAYAVLGIFTWSYLMLFILDIIKDLEKVTTRTSRSIIKFGRRIGSHNYYKMPSNYA